MYFFPILRVSEERSPSTCSYEDDDAIPALCSKGDCLKSQQGSATYVSLSGSREMSKRCSKVGYNLWGGGIPSQLILCCRWCALLLTRSVNTQLALCGAGSGALDVTGCGGRATCSWSRLTALLLGRLLGVLLFTEARSMGRAVRWSQTIISFHTLYNSLDISSFCVIISGLLPDFTNVSGHSSDISLL
jgi:hypothetical protein